MKEFFIKTILSWLAGLTADQWKFAVNKVVMIASDKNLPGKEKALWFNKAFQVFAGSDTASWAVNLIRELAVAFARRKGLIK